MNNKGAMELSVTAIVILILAIVMLGLGLGFIRGMFTKVSSSFEEQISAEPEPPEASSSEPITLSRENMIVNAGSNTVLKIRLYNPSNNDWSYDGAWGCLNFTDVGSCGATANDPQYGCAWSTSCTGTASVCTGFVATGTTEPTKLANCNKQIGCYQDDTLCKNAAGIMPFVRCSGMSAITQKMNAKPIKQGESVPFNDLMTIPKAVAQGTYLCQASVAGQYQKDFTIKVIK